MNLRMIGLTKAFFIMFICLGTFQAQAQSCTNAVKLAAEDGVIRLNSVYDFGGSTFTACKTGMVTSITFKVTKESAAQPKALFFLENQLGNGVEENQSYADYHQAISIKGDGKTTTVNLKKPFPVVKGEFYTWYVQKDPDAGQLVQAAAVEPSNTYDTGNTWYNNDYYPTMDTMFSVKIK